MIMAPKVTTPGGIDMASFPAVPLKPSWMAGACCVGFKRLWVTVNHAVTCRIQKRKGTLE